MSFYNRKKLSGVIYLVTAFVLSLVIVGNYFAFGYSRMVSQFFGQETFRIETSSDAQIDSDYYTSNYTKLSKLIQDETQLALEIQKEGVVLLKNVNLPLAATDKTVALLGATSKDSVYHSGGSGSGAVNVTRAPMIADCFTNAGFEVNSDLLAFYAENGAASGRVTEEPNASLLPSFTADVGVVFIGRSGGESLDLTFDELKLSEDEKSIIDLSIANCKKTVVLLNTSNPLELGYIADKDVSVIWAGASGEISVGLIPEILKGTYCPSGKLVDTYAYDNRTSPVFYAYGDFNLSNVEDRTANKYVNYSENIYYGYRYYETRYADKVAGVANVGDFDYAACVQYPFGYGLSYTQFDYSNFTVQENGNQVILSVTVTNSGDCAGKEAVEFYMQSPYTDYDRANGIEKSAIQLVGFAKTAELAPKASATVSCVVSKEEMKAYDAKTAKTFIVDAGDYYFAAGKNVHDAMNNILAAQGYTVANGMTENGNASLAGSIQQAGTDTVTYAASVTGTAITNHFDHANLNTYMPTTYMTRSNWEGTFPVQLKDMDATEQMMADAKYLVNAVADISEKNAVMPRTGAQNGLVLASMITKNDDGSITKLNYDDPNWDLLLDQLTPDEMMTLFAVGGYGTAHLPSINKPASIDRDGPATLNASMMGGTELFAYPAEILIASTWNIDLAEQMASFIAEDGLISGVQGWYAPGINVHRSPAAGRNFEYYSEDPVQTGLFASAVATAAQNKGLVVYIKHFALNEQEVNRSAVCTFATEQAIREIYLKPFEMAVIHGGAKGIMNSMNRIGMVWAGANNALLVDVTRNEWGFKGIMITDAVMSANTKVQALTTLLGGSDLMLCPNSGTFAIPGFDGSATVMSALRESAHRVLYAFADSAVMNGMSANTRIVALTPAWQKALIAADVVAGILMLLAVVLTTRSLVKAARKERGAH